MRTLPWTFAFLFVGCGAPPKTAELVALEQLRAGEYTVALREQLPNLHKEADAAYQRALTSHQDGDPERSLLFTRLGTIIWRTATARIQQKEFADTLRVSQNRLRLAQEKLSDARRRKSTALDAISRQERLLNMQRRLSEAEKQAGEERRAAGAKAQLDAAALKLKEAEALEAARHAPGGFNKAQAALKMALDAFQGGRYKETERIAVLVIKDAEAASLKARPLFEREQKIHNIDQRMKAMLGKGEALEGVEARIERRGLILTLRGLFASRKTKILAGKLGSVKQSALIAKENPDFRIIVEGHTDNRGRSARNLKLSEARAQAVLLFLSQQGISAARLSALGLGDEQPVSDNSSKSGRAQNRRVNLVFLRPRLN